MEVPHPTWRGGLQPSLQGAPSGLPAEGAPSRVSGLRARLQPEPGTGPAAPPPQWLCWRARREQSRSESGAPRRAPGAHRAPTLAAAQPPAVSSAHLRARRAGRGARPGARLERANCSGALAAYSLSPPPTLPRPRLWPVLAFGILAGPRPPGPDCWPPRAGFEVWPFDQKDWVGAAGRPGA